VQKDLWKPIQIPRGGPKLAHLAFADDLLLFAEASLEQINYINIIMDFFCRSSGQKVSKEKTRIFFSKNVPWQLRHQICDVAGFQSMEDLGKYLGVPLLHKRVTDRSFNFIIKKVDQRLSKWKTKTLSFAGRLTLAKSVIQAMPSYVMQSTLLLVHICDEIDRKCKNFI